MSRIPARLQNATRLSLGIMLEVPRHNADGIQVVVRALRKGEAYPTLVNDVLRQEWDYCAPRQHGRRYGEIHARFHTFERDGDWSFIGGDECHVSEEAGDLSKMEATVKAMRAINKALEPVRNSESVALRVEAFAKGVGAEWFARVKEGQNQTPFMTSHVDWDFLPVSAGIEEAERRARVILARQMPRAA